MSPLTSFFHRSSFHRQNRVEPPSSISPHLPSKHALLSFFPHFWRIENQNHGEKLTVFISGALKIRIAGNLSVMTDQHKGAVFLRKIGQHCYMCRTNQRPDNGHSEAGSIARTHSFAVNCFLLEYCLNVSLCSAINPCQSSYRHTERRINSTPNPTKFTVAK